MSNTSDFVIENGVLTEYVGPGGDVVVPDGITKIANRVFYGYKKGEGVVRVNGNDYGFESKDISLTSIVLPDGLIEIGDYAFSCCTELKRVSFPESLKKLGRKAFAFCVSLKDIELPKDLAEIDHQAFEACICLTSVSIPDNIAVLPSAFSDCSKLVDVKLPKELRTLGSYAFSNCSSLKNVEFPESLNSIESNAFYECSSLERVVFPKSLKAIGSFAFSKCRSLKSIDFSETVEEIQDYAFYGCNSLEKITLPEGVTRIGDSAFSDCGSLSGITFSEGLITIGNAAFSGCGSLKAIALSKSVKCIGNRAFSRCGNLDSVAFPKELTTIGDSAFSDCVSLRSADLPDGVINAGDAVFSGCTNLEEAILPGSLTSSRENKFKNFFWGCKKLHTLAIRNKGFKLTEKCFGDTLPPKLIPQLRDIVPNMNDGALAQYVLNKTVWSKLPNEEKLEIFMTRQGKTLASIYKKCISAKELDSLYSGIIDCLSGNPSTKECAAAACFMELFYSKIEKKQLQEMYNMIKCSKNGSKAISVIEQNIKLFELLGETVEISRDTPPAEQFTMARMLDEKRSASDVEKLLKNYYSLKIAELPPLHDMQGTLMNEIVLAWLLTTHETMKKEKNKDDFWDEGKLNVVAAYKKAGIKKEAEELVSLLDPNSLQSAIVTLADSCLGLTGRSKKMFLAYPICRYACEETMAEVCRRAPKWRSSVSGNNAPPLLTFRKACLYSNTRAAMLFADKYKELDAYAKIRGTTADTIRDTVLSDLGFDSNGRKAYDLGASTVTATLSADLTVGLFDDAKGKSVKSVPKAGADEEKYAAAVKDYAELKKAVKKVAKNRIDTLFEAYLDGKTYSAESWIKVYQGNPVLNMVARLLVWEQGGRTFTLSESGLIDSDGLSYSMSKKPVQLAHPMEMTAADVVAWQVYFVGHGLKQPFEQIWEPVHREDEIKADRFDGCEVPLYRFMNQTKRGITLTEGTYEDESFTIEIVGCDLEYELKEETRHGKLWEMKPDSLLVLGSFSFEQYTRRVNHIVAYLDRATVWERVRNDDTTTMDLMPGFTLAQITEFIAAAQEANATNVLAALLEYKNAHFADFDPMEEFTLER